MEDEGTQWAENGDFRNKPNRQNEQNKKRVTEQQNKRVTEQILMHAATGQSPLCIEASTSSSPPTPYSLVVSAKAPYPPRFCPSFVFLRLGFGGGEETAAKRLFCIVRKLALSFCVLPCCPVALELGSNYVVFRFAMGWSIWSLLSLRSLVWPCTAFGQQREIQAEPRTTTFGVIISDLQGVRGVQEGEEEVEEERKECRTTQFRTTRSPATWWEIALDACPTALGSETEGHGRNTRSDIQRLQVQRFYYRAWTWP